LTRRAGSLSDERMTCLDARSNDPLRVLVVGAGAVGCYFGGLLAIAGSDVTFVARGAQRAALASNGLTLEGPRGRIVTPPLRAYGSVAEAQSAAPAQIVLLCVKTYDVLRSAAEIAAAVPADAIVVALQNGVDADTRFTSVAQGGPACVAGIAYVSAVVERPGHVRYTSDMSELVFGKFPTHAARDATALVAAAHAAGFACRVAEDIRAELWGKFILLACNAALTCLARAPAGIVYYQPALARLARQAIEECVLIARAEGIAMPDDAVDSALARARGFPPDMYASMYHDLIAGKSLEIDQLSGEIVRRATAHGIDVPFHYMASACLRAQTPSAKGRRDDV
jgi:2-dehydropantoate 2-reductase